MMTVAAPFQLRFSDVSIRFFTPTPVLLPIGMDALLCEDSCPPDAEYQIQLLQEPLQLKMPPFHVCEGTAIYHTSEGWLRSFSPQSQESGCQVACLLRSSKNNTLYVHAPLWGQLSRPFHCFHMIGLEDILLKRNAFLLHSSVVMHQGKAILFCGSSGVGKSTQANLWKKHLGAEILNGDRCVVMKKGHTFYGGGCPLAGTSGIYRPEQAPIAGIFLVGHGKQNCIQPLGREAFSPLFSQTLVNSWNTDFMEKVIEFYQELITSVPIYRFDCLPNETAVQTAYRSIF